MLSTKQVKEYAKKCGADLVGIGSMDRFEGAPKEMDPRYVFPEAKVIIGLAFRIPRGYLRGIEEGTQFYQYTELGYTGINEVYAPIVIRKVCCFLEDNGYEGVGFRNTGGRGPVSDMDGRERGPSPEEHQGRVIPFSEPVSPDKPAPDVQFHFRIAAYMCGYGRNEKELKDTLTALGKTPLVCGELVYPYEEKSEEYPQYANKATLLRRATDATGGFLIYTLAELDGRTFYSIGEVSRLISDCEEFFIEHKKDNSLVNVEGISMDNVVVFTSGRKRLIILINETNEEKEVKIENKKIELGMDVYDYYENKKLDDGKVIKCKVMPKDVKVFVVR